MSGTLARVRQLVTSGKWRPTTHALLRLNSRNILLRDVIDGLGSAVVVEDYPLDQRGPSVLILSFDASGLPLHAQWGIPLNNSDIANLVTIYSPDPAQWRKDWLTRR